MCISHEGFEANCFYSAWKNLIKSHWRVHSRNFEFASQSKNSKFQKLRFHVVFRYKQSAMGEYGEKIRKCRTPLGQNMSFSLMLYPIKVVS